MTDVATHNQRLDGVTVFVFAVRNEGAEITVSGWNSLLKWRNGDFVVLDTGKRTTRYEVKNVRRMVNPPDQYFADMTFAPRQP
jgi:hypothetical protein